MLTILILSYNRPKELERLLENIISELPPLSPERYKIHVAEDCSPRQDEIRVVVDSFIARFETIGSQLIGFYNDVNLGYDANFRNSIDRVDTEYVMIFGDDDIFEDQGLIKVNNYLESNPNLTFVLRAWRSKDIRSEKTQRFRYFPYDFNLPAKFDNLLKIFRKSIFISGLIFNTEFAKRQMDAEFDGTLLYQLYLLTRLSDTDRIGYIGEEIVCRFEGGEFFFGSSENEPDFTPNILEPQHSLSFIKMIKIIIDRAEFSKQQKEALIKDFSKYSFSLLSIQKKSCSFFAFLKYAYDVYRLGFASSFYFYVYLFLLLLLGHNLSEKLIISLKNFLRNTPRL